MAEGADKTDIRALVTLLAVIFLSIAGFGVVIPLLPFFGHAFGAEAWQITLLFSAFSMGQFLGEPFWGRLSDRIGRRPVLAMTICGAALSYVALAFCPNIVLAWAARFVGGFLSGNISTLQGALADMTPPRERAAKMGLMGAAFSLGFMTGPALGGLLARPALGPAGFHLPLFAAAGFGLAAAVAVLIFVREAREPDRHAPQASRLEALREAAAHPVISRILIIGFVVVSGFAGIEATYGLWTEHRFGWGPRQIGLAFMFIGAFGALCQGVFNGQLVRRFGEVQVLTLGMVFMFVGMVVQCVSLNWPMAMAGFAFVSFGQSVCFPNLTALMSRSAPPHRQGEMLGLNMSSNALARIGGPIYAGQIFSLISPGAPFALTAILIIPALWLARQVGARVKTAI
ncbi:MFS transporter [Phenylobacterium sp.]|uniref:MFS transporter n=1 Tax=Phenylobacterium sp. TaxID=1871053 RepID=UPI0035AEBC6E